jgi:peptidoglycan-associated lipoprotein
LRFNTTVRLGLISIAALTIAACQTPRPRGPAAPSQPPAGDPGYTAPSDPGGVTQSPAGNVVPGSVQDFVINVGELVYFDTDRYDLRGDAAPVLDAQAAWLRNYPNVRIRIEGNADERGTREYNFALGARRANTVRDYLVGRGIAAARVETISYGKERPIDARSNEEAWARNRNARTALIEGAR